MDGVVHPNVEQAIGRDRIRKALKRYENRPADEHRYGIVRSVNEGGSYEVLLDGDVQTSRCVAGCTAGVGDRVLVCIMANGRCVAVSRLEGEYADFEKETAFQKIVNFFGNLYLANAKYLHARNANGDARNALGMNSTNQLLLGYGGYDNSEGSTNLYGNRILMMDKGNGNAICSLNGGFLLPEGADLNGYVTVGNYYSNNSTLSSSLKNTPYTGGSLSLKVICPYGTSVTGNSTIVQEMTVSNGRQYWRRTGDTGETWTDWYLNLSERDVLDYVTAQGNSGSWYYRKWASGWAECYGTVNKQSVPMTSQWGGVYESNSTYYMTYPFTFAEQPWWVISVNESSGGVLSIEAEGSDGSTTRTANFRFTRGTSGTQSVTYTCFAFGRWK